MKNLLIILSVFIFSAIFTVNAGSQGMGMMHGKDHGAMWSANMQNMDTSKDGKISRDEWNKYYDNIFTRIDMNKNGFIDDKEIQAYHRSMTGSMMNGGNREMMGKSYVAKMDTNKDGRFPGTSGTDITGRNSKRPIPTRTASLTKRKCRYTTSP